jgi:protease-4
MLHEARTDPSIDAVVLVSNSPGGAASASETLYLEVSRTAEQMPVVASVDAMAASGSYYAIAPTDHIYAKPSSLVGSVGVFVTKPTDPQPLDQVVASGPKKLSGGNERDWSYKTESLRRAFVGAVFESRGDALTISRQELSKANLVTGAQAVRNGMADDIGGTSEAISDAARRAGLDDYRVKVLRPDGGSVFISRTNYVASDAADKRLVSPTYFVGTLGEDPTVPNVLMLPPSVVAAAIEDEPASTERATPAGNETTEEAP